jgi:hypothetical protein
MKVPVTDEILKNAVYEGRDLPKGQIPAEPRTIVTIQQRVDVFKNPNRVSLTTRYAELDGNGECRDDVDPKLYSKVTDSLIYGRGECTVEELLELQQSKSLQNLIVTAAKDDVLREKLKEVVKKTVKYTEETGEILDLLEYDNFVFYPDDNGGWNYSLVDALYPSNPQLDMDLITVVKEAVQKLS